MNVSNNSYIHKVSKNIIKNNKGRTKITILAIMLTCILFTTLFLVVFGIEKSMEFQTMKSIGTISHGAFKDVTDKDIEILSKDKEVISFSKRTMVGIMQKNKIYAEVSYQDEQGMEWSIFENVKGRYPQNIDEVFVDTQTLKALGYSGELGEEIQIDFDIIKKSTSEILGHKKATFRVVGTYTQPIDSNVQIGQVYVSKNYVESVDLPDRNNEMGVNFSNSWRIKDKLTRVANRNGYEVIENLEDNTHGNTIRIGVNFAYFSNNSNFDFLELVVPTVVLILVVMLAGYLLISNIFMIGIIQDIQVYGLLKTVGMTSRQIRKVVNKQGIYLSVPAIVLGNFVGINLGSKLLEKVLSSNEMLANIKIGSRLMLFIVVLSAIFSLITVFISCLKPARAVSKISPIDSVKFQEKFEVKKVKSNKFSIAKLAMRQVFSKKIRFASIILSISLSAVILNSVFSYTKSIDMEKGVSDVIRTDYNVANPRYFRYMYLGSEESLNREYIEKIKSESSFKKGGAIYSYGSGFDYPKLKIDGLKCNPIIFGMDDYILNKQSLIDGELNQTKWDTGKYAYVGEDEQMAYKSKINVGDRLLINFDGKEIEVEVLGKIRHDFSNGLRYRKVVFESGNYQNSGGEKELNEEYIYLSSNVYTELFGSSEIMSYGFDVENSEQDKMNSLLNELELNSDFQYDSRQRQIDSLVKFKDMIEFAGYSIASILFIIGVLNFINIISTDIVMNKSNLAVFEALGMTKKQSQYYLVFKSLMYSLNGFILSIVLKVVLDKFILEKLINSATWTTYRFGLKPILYINTANILIGIAFTILFYNLQRKNSLIERINRR
ncbi:FtsX-like permease family protein [Peptoniphilus asaccharolyticus]